VSFHSYHGCPYTSRESLLLTSELGTRLSVSHTDQCWDNALTESFFAPEERTDRRPPRPSRAAAHTAVFERIEGRYNAHRLHGSPDYRSPADYEAALAA
jgi:transposase InsO family protein